MADEQLLQSDVIHPRLGSGTLRAASVATIIFTRDVQ
jgi:hypothetical protein